MSDNCSKLESVKFLFQQSLFDQLATNITNVLITTVQKKSGVPKGKARGCKNKLWGKIGQIGNKIIFRITTTLLKHLILLNFDQLQK